MEKEKSNSKKKSQNKSRKGKNNKKLIIIWTILIVLIIVVIAVIVYMKNKTTDNEGYNEIQGNETESYVEEIEDGIKINKSTKLNEAKEIEGLTISNIQLTTEGGMTTLLADVTNNSGVATQVKPVEITLVKEDGTEIAKVTGVINALDVGETAQLNISTTSDYVDAYDFIVSAK